MSELEAAPSYSDALRAYDMRRQGKSLTHILRHTNYRDGTEAMMAIKSIEDESALLARRDRDSAVEMSMSRIDDAIAACYDVLDAEKWVYDKNGTAVEPDYDTHLKAAKTLVQAVKAQADIMGLTKVDPMINNEVVVLIQGDRDNYVRQLQEIVEEG